MIKIQRTSYKPLYLQISDSIREMIENNNLKPGDRIPSERELMEDLNVSRNTAKQAIEELVRSGLVMREQGKGTFVIEQKINYGLQRLTSFSEEMLRKGVTPSSKIISLVKEHPKASIANRLSIDESDWVYKLQRIRYGDDKPMALQLSYLSARLCPGLDQFDFSQQSLYSVMESEYKLVISWQQQVIKPITARQEEALHLDLMVGMPLLLAEGVAFLQDDTPIEANRIIYRSDLYEFSVYSVRENETNNRRNQ